MNRENIKMKTILVTITEACIKKHQHSKVMLRDKQLPFLFFRYAKNYASAGSIKGSFHLSFGNQGKTTSRIIGRYPLLGVKSVRLEASKKYVAIQRDKLSVTKASTFEHCGELLKWYLEFRFAATAGGSHKTKSNIAHQINHVLCPILDDLQIEQLNSRFLAEKWLIPSYAVYKLSTLKGGFQCLKAAFSQGLKLGYIETNPLSSIAFGDLTASKVKPKKCKIQSRDLQNLVNQIRSFDPAMKMMCFLCLGFLTRNSETASARWEHFNFKQMLWNIPAENTKTGQSVSHPITPGMLVLLKKYRVWQRHKTRSQFLFPQQSGYKAISASQAANKLAALSNKRFSLHDLRKYGSSYLRDLGVDYYIVERILNHKMTTLDQTYIHTSVANIIRTELEKWHTDYIFN